MRSRIRLPRLLQAPAALPSTQYTMNTSTPVKGGSLPREKANKEMVKVASPINVQLVTNTGNQAVAHKDTIVESIIQGDNQADVQSVALLATILLNAHVQ